MDQLGHNDFNLKFIMECSHEKIMFLDVQIEVDKYGNVFPDLYRKPSSANTIVHATRAHPKSLVQSIPYGQYLRLRCNFTREEDIVIRTNELRERLLKRGYTKTCLKKAFKKAMQRTKHSLIH